MERALIISSICCDSFPLYSIRIIWLHNTENCVLRKLIYQVTIYWSQGVLKGTPVSVNSYLIFGMTWFSISWEIQFRFSFKVIWAKKLFLNTGILKQFLVKKVKDHGRTNNLLDRHTVHLDSSPQHCEKLMKMSWKNHFWI